MSRVGKKPIVIVKGVDVKVHERQVVVKGPKGQLTRTLPEGIDLVLEGGSILVQPVASDVDRGALHGLVRNLVANMVKGVTEGFTKDLELVGVGYRAEVKGRILQLALGFSHPVLFPIPEGLEMKVANQNRITISGANRELLGQTAAEIRDIRPPEPYQGKGVRYLGEVIRRKVGKAAAGATGGK